MKNLVLIICLCCLYFGRVHAQNTYSVHPNAEKVKNNLPHFYIKPYIEYKVASFMYNGYGTNGINNNPYFRYENKPLVFPLIFDTKYKMSDSDFIRFGFLLGYSFFQNRFAIECGLGIENVTTKSFVYYQRYDANISPSASQSVYSTRAEWQKSSTGIRIPLLFSMQLLKKDSVSMWYGNRNFRFKINLKFGLNYLRLFNQYDALAGYYEPIETTPNVYITMGAFGFQTNRTSIMPQLGLDFDFYFKKLKGFSLSLYYLHGSKDLYTTGVSVLVTGYTPYSYSTISRGSGLYLQLSKKINF